MELPNLDKKEWAAIGVTAALMVGFVVQDNWPDEVQNVTDAAKEAIIGNEPAPESSTIENTEQCQNIVDIPLQLKIGSLVLPMAEVTELDQLQRVIVNSKISSFAFVAENSGLTDTVGLNGTVLPITDAVAAVKQKGLDSNGIKVTFALDEEGGRVQRTESLTGYTRLPSAAEQSLMTEEELSSLMLANSQQISALGVDVVFGPVADVGNDVQVGDRSYGTSVNLVSEKAGVVIDARASAGVESTLKHFPGLGSVSTDTHNEAGSTQPLDILLQNSVPSFTSLIAEHDPSFVMVSHASTEDLTEVGQPASLSPAVYSLLRGTSNFKGVAITDALNMGAIQTYLGLSDTITSQATASVMAINAGADMVIVSLDAAEPSVQYITTAVNQSNPLISIERINESSKRVLEAKGYSIC